MRIHLALPAALLAVLIALPAHAKDDDDDYAKLAPFTGVRYAGEARDEPQVRVKGDWYQLKAIDDVKAHDLVAFAKKTFGGRWQKRIAEDLVEVLTRMGHKPGQTVKLMLVDMKNLPVVLPDVAMTRENRQRAQAYRRGQPPAPAPSPPREPAKDAPFTAARLDGDQFVMEVQGIWYRLRSIDGIAADDLVAHARRRYRGTAEKRLVEDLVQVMADLGKVPGDHVALELTRLEDGGDVTLPNVPMTEENRRSAWRARQLAARGGPVRRVGRRRLAKSADPRYAPLMKLVEGARDRIFLSQAQALEDLDQLEWLVKNVHAYATLRGNDLDAMFDAARLAIRGARVSRNTFAIHVMKILALLGDGHARVVENPARVLAPGFLPFLISDAGGKPVAYAEDRSRLLDPANPYVDRLDGVPIQRWIDAASRLVPRGSPQLVRERSLRLLRHIQHVRRELGLPETPTIEVTLVNFSDTGVPESRNTGEHALADRKPLYGTWPETKTRVLPGDIPYLRIAQMRRAPAPSENPFAKAKGLIIDVRGNGGGSRDALLTLLPLFLPKGEAVLANVAAYRLPPDATPNQEGHLQDRHLFPETSDHWDGRRDQLEALTKGFEPRWKLPPGFSDLHFLVVRNEDATPFTGPVILLTDAGCFSATDVFVGAFQQLKNVTVLGTATAGGSGRSRSYELEHSRLRLRLSSMASFQPNGELYDTNGIAPDVEVPIQPTDLIGKTDSALEAALERLK